MTYRFQVHLRGLIDLLAKHLYGRPQVFVRELLQNAVDAITERRAVEENHGGQIEVELLASRDGRPILCFSDNGAGLAEEDVHQFVATIGASSKRDANNEPLVEAIGQFGIGLLSAFVVSDEIVLVSRSIRKQAQAIEWRGSADGTYSVRTLANDVPFGTTVYLTARDECREFFEWPQVRYFLEYYGALLPYPVWLVAGSRRDRVNYQELPWRKWNPATVEGRRELLRLAAKVFKARFLDVLPLHACAGKVEGVAFVLAEEVNLAARPRHRVYLKNMLLSDSLDTILPQWAFFVTAMVNATDLHPTASRESLREDQELWQARDQLGLCLRNALLDLARREPERFERILQTHEIAIRALSARDETCYRAFIDWIRFETSRGVMPVRQLRAAANVLTYVEHARDFEHVLPLAKADDLLLVNAGHEYDVELLARLPDLFENLIVQPLNLSDLVNRFSPLADDERPLAQQLLAAANELLRPLRCHVQVRRFSPAHVPAVYLSSPDCRRRRRLKKYIAAAEPLYAGMLEKAIHRDAPSCWSTWCLNWSNHTVRSLARWPCGTFQRKLLALLYSNSLLQAGVPLDDNEYVLLSEGLNTVVATLGRLTDELGTATN